MNILGISCFYHESAAALLCDGKIIAASAEERFSRKKHDASFPQEAITFCLQQGKINTSNLDYIVFYEKPFRKFERNLMMSLEYFPKSYSLFTDSMKNFLTEKLWIKSIIASKLHVDAKKILFVPHHLSHAAASYYPSPFKEAAFLTLDGTGEWTTGCWGNAMQNKLYPKAELLFPHSIGLLYAAFTAFLGFEVNDGEYKVMGMAGFGKPIHIDRVKKLYIQNRDGSIILNLNYFAFQYSSKKMYTDMFENLFKGLSFWDIAASVQTCTEEIICNMLTHIAAETKHKNLIFGGGVALNSVLNGKIIEKTPFRDVFIFPASGDDGGAIGASLYLYHHVLGIKKRYFLENVFLGPQFSINQNLQISNKNFKVKEMPHQQLLDYVSSKLSEGKVIGWFEGRSEFGPRALGHRSILADPRKAEMKDIVNKKIKFREEFRPFAPAILAEHAHKYFLINLDRIAPFMLGAFKAKPLTKKVAPAIVHIDGTSRVQLVSKEYSGNFRELLEVYYKKTGVPILMNTSFNVKGEPIVNSPKDALATFQKSGIDILVLENFVVEKK